MLKIRLANNSSTEKATEDLLRKMLEQYDLEPLVFTYDILIKDDAIPHSHPVLTLNGSMPGDYSSLLASFIHEQMHWYMSSRRGAMFAAIEELQREYPCLPNEKNKIARSEFSTYLHLIINMLEFQGIERFFGLEQAKMIISQKSYYTWIYKQVLERADCIVAIMSKHDLTLPAANIDM